VPVTDADLISPVVETQKSSSPSFAALERSFCRQPRRRSVCDPRRQCLSQALRRAGTVAGAVKASRLHADIIRIPVLFVSAVRRGYHAGGFVEFVACPNRPAARWRKKPMTLREKFSFGITLVASVLTVALVVGEVIEHPIFHVH